MSRFNCRKIVYCYYIHDTTIIRKENCQKKRHMAFVDLKKVYDSVPRTKMCEGMQKIIRKYDKNTQTNV